MYLKEADLFRNLSGGAMSEITAIMVEEFYEPGAVLFGEGDPASHFYVLMEGRVRLAVGEGAEVDYTVSNPGEAFGWSSLVDRTVYTAGAECETPTRLIKMEREDLQKIFQKYPESGTLFYKRLAGAIGDRLISAYKWLLSEQKPSMAASYGTGRMMAAGEE